jgi:hypothetical protein
MDEGKERKDSKTMRDVFKYYILEKKEAQSY